MKKILSGLVLISAQYLLAKFRIKSKNLCNVKKVRKCFIFMFALIQNSKTVEQLDTTLKEEYIIFNRKVKDQQVTSSLHSIRSKIIERDLNKIKTFEDFTVDEDIRNFDHNIDLEESNLIFFSRDYKDSILKSSPFTHYYEELFKSWKIEDDRVITNEYYNPKLFELIEKQMHICPIWTGIMLNNYDEKFNSRLTNNVVENYFGFLKNNLLKRKKLFPSKLTAILTKNITAQYIENNSHKDIS